MCKNDHIVPLHLTTNCQQSTGTKEIFSIYWTENYSVLCKYLFKSVLYFFWCVNIWSLEALLVLWLCFGYDVTGHFKRLSVPRSHLDVKVIEIMVQQGYAFFKFWSFFMKFNRGHFWNIPVMARCSLLREWVNSISPATVYLTD